MMTRQFTNECFRCQATWNKKKCIEFFFSLLQVCETIIITHKLTGVNAENISKIDSTIMSESTHPIYICILPDHPEERKKGVSSLKSLMEKFARNPLPTDFCKLIFVLLDDNDRQNHTN